MRVSSLPAMILTLMLLSSTSAPGLAEGGFFSRHPVLRKVAKGAALGVVTGGVGSVVLGHGLAAGAVAGAGRGAAFSAAKEKIKERKHHHQ